MDPVCEFKTVLRSTPQDFRGITRQTGPDDLARRSRTDSVVCVNRRINHSGKVLKAVFVNRVRDSKRYILVNDSSADCHVPARCRRRLGPRDT